MLASCPVFRIVDKVSWAVSITSNENGPFWNMGLASFAREDMHNK